MKSAVSALIILFWIGLPSFCQTAPSGQSGQPQGVPELQESYHFVQFLPSYRFVSTSGFLGRVAEYDSLDQSVGGDMTLTYIDFARRYSWKYRANLISRDDYDMDFKLTAGKIFTLGINSRSLIRHLEDIPFGTNLDDPSIGGETSRTDSIPESALFGVKRTRNTINSRLKLPDTPVTLFVKGGFQSRRGWSQMQYFAMGSSPDPQECGGCHSVSQFRHSNYTTRDIAGGVELKVAHVSLSYQHAFSSFNDRMQNPSDLYGSALSIIPDEPLPPGVPNTPQGNYIHNLLPSHRTFSDTVRMRAPIWKTLVFNGSATYGHTKNNFTGNPMKFFHADATLNWNPIKRLRAMADFHQQNTINNFIPLLTFYGQNQFLTITDPNTGITTPYTPTYAQFGNPSMHRYWTGVRLDYELSSNFDAETYYRRTDLTRSNWQLWPQIYSPNNAALLGVAVVDPFTARLVPETFSNTAGFSIRFHRGEMWNVRTGYEWIGTHAPGYLTDPGTSHRIFVSGVLSPKSWLSFSDDFSIQRENSFPSIQRDNRLYLNTSYIILKPVADWSLAAGYAYYQNNLKTDVLYLSDLGIPAVYLEPLVPFKAISQGVTVSSTYVAKKKLALNLEAGHVSSNSGFRPNVNDPSIPSVCGTTGDISCAVSVPFGSAFSRVAVPEIRLSSVLDYRFKGGFDSGLRFQFGSYTQYQYGLVNPDLTLNPQFLKQTGILRTYSIFAGRTW